MTFRLVVVAFLMLLAPPAPAQNAAVPVPVELPRLQAGEPVLKVGATGARTVFSPADLEALPLHRVTTSTFWPADDGTYEGPLLADVLKRAGLGDAAAVKATARDGFSQVIPGRDWTRWPILVATRRDGKPMAVRDKGPLRIIYPRDMDKELHDTIYRLRWVWLLESLEPASP
ncbi:molybdopterin-dependent oxidoreductase [Magnetospirillum sp. UT-4]|uniref:molybdopterin-dependent oxidoreductase n=1 Tax=Magnetospirillum sp. UT-4 TaxID=2681467 RepID=UPI0013860088|nr:molybdopterin-dependent oxidoreductase [Magnetospirillum sp. UT-4]CAA7615089.1 conserved exported hypothetical protein [Magnetospirillum sp. UT-4]